MSDKNNSFETWAVLELYGHQKIAGLVTEQTIGGCSFIRVDVPELDGAAGFTKFYGNGAIYAMTPTTEEVVRRVVANLQPRPISLYEIEVPRALPAPRRPDELEDDEYDPEDDEREFDYEDDYGDKDTPL